MAGLYKISKCVLFIFDLNVEASQASAAYKHILPMCMHGNRFG